VPARRGLRRSHPQRREAGRSAGTGAYQVRASDQPQDGEGVRHRRPGVGARARRRGDRMIGRREFITLLGGATAWPLTARAQQAGRVRRVGVLTMGAEVSPFEAAFQQALADLGYVVGQNLLLEYRRAAFKVDRLPQLATELVAANVDVILALGSEPTGA